MRQIVKVEYSESESCCLFISGYLEEIKQECHQVHMSILALFACSFSKAILVILKVAS